MAGLAAGKQQISPGFDFCFPRQAAAILESGNQYRRLCPYAALAVLSFGICRASRMAMQIR